MLKPWRVAVVGSRSYPSMPRVRAALRELADVRIEFPTYEWIILSGGAPGVDKVAIEEARRLGFKTEVIAADWKTYGKAAGPLRNTEIVKRADRVIAFWDERSRGTRDVIKKALAAGKDVRYVDPNGRIVDNLEGRVL